MSMNRISFGEKQFNAQFTRVTGLGAFNVQSAVPRNCERFTRAYKMGDTGFGGTGPFRDKSLETRIADLFHEDIPETGISHISMTNASRDLCDTLKDAGFSEKRIMDTVCRSMQMYRAVEARQKLTQAVKLEDRMHFMARLSMVADRLSQMEVDASPMDVILQKLLKHAVSVDDIFMLFDRMYDLIDVADDLEYYAHEFISLNETIVRSHENDTSIGMEKPLVGYYIKAAMILNAASMHERALSDVKESMMQIGETYEHDNCHALDIMYVAVLKDISFKELTLLLADANVKIGERQNKPPIWNGEKRESAYKAVSILMGLGFTHNNIWKIFEVLGGKAFNQGFIESLKHLSNACFDRKTSLPAIRRGIEIVINVLQDESSKGIQVLYMGILLGYLEAEILEFTKKINKTNIDTYLRSMKKLMSDED
jgi:hypothetical protein